MRWGLAFTLISILLSVGPIAYGLYLYDWNIEAFVTPSFEMPEIHFQVDVTGYSFKEDKVVFNLSITNQGDIDIEIYDIDAWLTNRYGQEITRVTLEKEVYIESGATGEVSFSMTLSEDSLPELIKYILKDSNPIFVINGSLYIRAFSSEVSFPIDFQFRLGSAELGFKPDMIAIDILSVAVIDDQLEITFEVSNPTPAEVIIAGGSLTLYSEDGELLTSLSIEEDKAIIPRGKGVVTAYGPVTDELRDFISRSIVEGQKASLTGEVYIDVYGVRFTIAVSQTISIGD